jgi:small conductance mechanosensitive channel
METAAEQQVTKTIDYFQEIWPALKVWGINLLVTLLILIIGLYLIKAVMKALDKAARQANADVTLARFMHSFVNIALYILLIFIVAGQLGINTASILAVLGTAGLAIAMSLKDSLSHFAGGILILFLRPFKVGDYIICSEGEGTIQEIGLVYTRVLTKDN